MEVDIDDSQVREQVKEHLKESGVIQSLEEKFRIGYTAVIDAIASDSDCPSIEYHPFSDAGDEEIIALQSIYKFLAEKHLMKTLSCLKSEANCDVDKSKARKLVSIIPESPLEREEKPNLDDRIQFQTPVEPSVEITRKDFQKNKFIIKVADL